MTKRVVPKVHKSSRKAATTGPATTYPTASQIKPAAPGRGNIATAYGKGGVYKK
jgi:hypothetical protein